MGLLNYVFNHPDLLTTVTVLFGRNFKCHTNVSCIRNTYFKISFTFSPIGLLLFPSLGVTARNYFIVTCCRWKT